MATSYKYFHFRPLDETSDGNECGFLSQSILRSSGRRFSSATDDDDDKTCDDVVAVSDLGSAAVVDPSAVEHASQENVSNSKNSCRSDSFEVNFDPEDVKCETEISQARKKADVEEEVVGGEDYDKIDPLWFEDELGTQSNVAAKKVPHHADVVDVVDGDDEATVAAAPSEAGLSTKPPMGSVSSSIPGKAAAKKTPTSSEEKDSTPNVKGSTPANGQLSSSPDSLAYLDFDTMDLIAEHNSRTSDVDLSSHLKSSNEKVLRVYFTEGEVGNRSIFTYYPSYLFT